MIQTNHRYKHKQSYLRSKFKRGVNSTKKVNKTVRGGIHL